MDIIAHRGMWTTQEEKNSIASFIGAFNSEFGIETDIRDAGGQLVIAHDMAVGNENPLKDVLALTERFQSRSIKSLALNIKADGLAASLHRELQGYTDLDIFVFDMSIPDMRSYLGLGFKVFVRISEVESDPPWLEQCDGVWLDSFTSDWFSDKLVFEILNSGKRLCVVSPELHGRNHQNLWNKLVPFAQQKALMLCTDLPLEACEFFEI